jgi:amidase
MGGSRLFLTLCAQAYVIAGRTQPGRIMTEVYATAQQMLADLAAKRISARELLELHVARNAALHGKLNAVVASDLDRARRDAQASDDARAKGTKLGALAGLPMTIKDGFDVEGLPATSGFPPFAAREKNCADAELVARARAAGAIVWGKTNVPLFLSDFQSYNAIYGTTNNPYDVTRTPGGSSGGAAAALAAGITPLEIGSDIGGSLRHPANFCGVCSLKPTWGVLPMRGHVPPPPGMDAEVDLGVAGPMARNADDLKLLWSVLHGRETSPAQPVKNARIAVWDEEPLFPLAVEVKAGVARAAEALSRQGARVEAISAPVDARDMLEAYLRLLAPIVTIGLPDHARAHMNSQRETDLKAVAAGAGPWSEQFYRLAATGRDDEIAAAMTARQALKDRMAEFFKDYDAILMPISPSAAFKHDHNEPFNARTLEVDGKTVPYIAMLGWIALATALHLPALAVAAGRTKSGLPVGVQVVGPWNGEDRLFDFALAIERELGGFSAPPL